MFALEVKPVGVGRYVTRLVEGLPVSLQDVLPTPRDIETELGKAKNRRIACGA